VLNAVPMGTVEEQAKVHPISSNELPMRDLAQSIVETIRHPLLILDSQLCIDRASSLFYSAFHLSERETVGRRIDKLGGGQWNIPQLLEQLQQVANNNYVVKDFLLNHDFPDIGSRNLQLNARPIYHDDGRLMVLLAIEDITEQQRAKVELRLLNKELEKRVVERTAELESANQELEAFCYSVSHDLRAPLRAIDGFSQQLLTGHSGQLDELANHYLGRIRNGSQRMGQLIDDLLKLSRLTRSRMRAEKVNLSALAQQVADEYHEAEPDRDVQVDIQPNLIVRGDPQLLRVVLVNLLGNARKFTSKCSSPLIEFGKTKWKDQTAFFVRDNGAGFDMTYSNKLFGAFQRLHGEHEFPGTGIGLATVKRIIRRHGGEVGAESAVDQGATFYFTLSFKEEESDGRKGNSAG